jgi:hypothetical protein
MLNTRFLIVCTATVMVAAIMPITGAVEVPETPDTPSTQQVLGDLQGCTRADADGNALVIAGPAAGFGLNWINPCVIIPNGGSVTWQQADGIPHGAIRPACFDLGRMSAVGGTPAASDPSSTTLQLDFDALEGIAYMTENGSGPGACEIAGEGSTLVVAYECIVHGARMPGKIIVEL